MLLEIAVGKHEKSPFRDELLQEGRKLVMAAIGMDQEAAARDPVPNQPFYLHLLSELPECWATPIGAYL